MPMNWSPARADHSIDRVLTTIRFSKPLSPDAFDEVAVKARKAAAARGLDRRVDTVEPIELELKGGTPVVIPKSATPARQVVFRRHDDADAVVEEYVVSGRQLSVNTLQYTRWSAMEQLIKDLIEP